MHRKLQLVMLLVSSVALTGIFHADRAEAAWYDVDFNRRIQFSVADGVIETGSSYADFTLLLELRAPEFADVFVHADPAGADLVITAADGTTVLDHELVSYDPVAQTGEIWFRAPTLSDLDRDFYLYYEQAAGTGSAASTVNSVPGAAWTVDHLAVYHFSEDPSLGQLKDWGPHMNDGTAAVAYQPVGPGWTSSNLVAGPVGTGWEFDGVDLWAYADGVSSADSSYTVSAWFANSQLEDKGAMAFQSPFGTWDLSFQRTEGNPNADLRTLEGTMSWLPDILDGDPHHFTWVLDAEADTARFYLDGIERGFWLRYTPPGEPSPIWTGETINGRVGIVSPTNFNALDLADGVADEFRLVAGVRGPDWVQTEFLNQSDPFAFYDIAAAEEYNGGPTSAGNPLAGLNSLGQLRVAPNPFYGIAYVSVETPLTDVTLQVFDLRGRLVRTLGQPARGGENMLRFLWNGRDESGTEVGQGVYFLRATSGSAVATGKAMLVR